jgi:hypothetical protein
MEEPSPSVRDHTLQRGVQFGGGVVVQQRIIASGNLTVDEMKTLLKIA